MEALQGLKENMTQVRDYEETGVYRKGQVAYDRETDNIIFYWDDESENQRYYMPLSRIQTPDKQMLFLEHIAGKGFLNEKVSKEFFECLKITGVMPEGEF
jgi:hypothetical protein